MSPAVTVIRIGADGWTGLTAEHRQLVLDADIVPGGRRHLDLLPAAENQIREPWPSPLRESAPALLWKYAGRREVALASGDPFVSGISGAAEERRVGKEGGIP